MQLRCFLKNDKEINYLINEVKQKVIKRQCGNDQDTYDLLIYKAGECVQKLDYIIAVKIYNDAINLANKHPDCKLNVVKANESRNKYQIPANYQMLTEEANNFYYKQDYMSFLDKYNEAESIVIVN